jgi:hypothetical protein
MYNCVTYDYTKIFTRENVLLINISLTLNHVSHLITYYCFLFLLSTYRLFCFCFYTNTVTASWREPILGWVDNLNGPTGLLAGAGKGVLRTLLCHKNLIADLVPVDICINLLISAAWYTAINR